MRRALRPKAKAVLGERRVPFCLQHLQNRLLDEAVEHRRNAERPCAARRLRYLHTPHRLRPVSALKQLSPDRGPVLFQVRGQGIDTHIVDTGGSLVALHLRQRLPQIVSLDNHFHRRPMGRLAFDFDVRRPGFGPFHAGASGFTHRSGLQGDLRFSFLPHGPSESTVLLAVHRSGLQRVAPPTTPSADFCAAVRTPCDVLSPHLGTQRRSPEVRSTAFTARPPNLPPRPLMAVDFAIRISLVRTGRPRYPVLVHRAAALLHASFRHRLATTPLRFANPSPPSGWIEDFHLQAVDHARRTPQGASRRRDASRRIEATAGPSWFSERCEASSGDGAPGDIFCGDGPNARLLTVRIWI
jgi:hypothetical protein